MKAKHLLKSLLCIVLLLSLFASTFAMAANENANANANKIKEENVNSGGQKDWKASRDLTPGPKPMDPANLPNQQLPIEATLDYQETIDTLNKIEATSQGRVDVFTLDDYGKSEKGQSLYVAKVGTGPTVIWLQARIHGGERITTPAVLEVLKTLGSSGNPEVEDLLSKLTIYAIPVYNPDGSDLNQRGTQLLDANGDVKPGKGAFDLNRDWKIDMLGEGAGFEANESLAFYKFYCDILPDYALDLHHQGTKELIVDGVATGESVSMSLGVSLAVDGPTLPLLYGGSYNTIAKQLHSYVYDDLIQHGYAIVDQYMGATTIDIYGGVVSAMMFGLNYMDLNPTNHSCPAIFFETRGIGQKAQGHFIAQNTVGVMSFFTGIASGDAFEMDPEHWYDIPHTTVTGYQTDYKGTPQDLIEKYPYLAVPK